MTTQKLVLFWAALVSGLPLKTNIEGDSQASLPPAMLAFIELFFAYFGFKSQSKSLLKCENV